MSCHSAGAPPLPGGTGSQQVTTSGASVAPGPGSAAAYQAQWEQRIALWYPQLDQRSYFLPAVHMNRLSYQSRSVAGQDVHVTTPPVGDRPAGVKAVSAADAKDDRAMQRVLHCLRALADNQNEAMFVLSALDFRNYLVELCSNAATATLFPRPADLKAKGKGKGADKGEFDLLVIHPTYGLLVGEVKSVGDTFSGSPSLTTREEAAVVKRVAKAVRQLDKEEAVLKHLVSDLRHPPRVRKTLLLPNVTRAQLRSVLASRPALEREMRRCLDPQNNADPTLLCMCANDVSHRTTPHFVTASVLTGLSRWWKYVITDAGKDAAFTQYRTVVARFAGPATTVEVFCLNVPPLCLRSEGDAVSETGNRFVKVVLNPDQVDALDQNQTRVFLCGPPGTGKALVLCLRALKWLKDGHVVSVVSTWTRSLAVSHVIFQQVRQMAGAVTAQNLHFHDGSCSFKETVGDLATKVDSQGRLFIIADEISGRSHGFLFNDFLEELHKDRRIRDLHLWTATCTRKDIPSCLTEVTLRASMRSPPAVIREVKQADIFRRERAAYPQFLHGLAPLPSDGPPVRWLDHSSPGHTAQTADQCFTCGLEVAGLLRTDLGVGQAATSASTTTPSPDPLTFKDVLFLTGQGVFEDETTTWLGRRRPACAFIRGLRQGGVPVRVVSSMDPNNLAPVAGVALTRGPDEAVATDNVVVPSLERKVVVVLEYSDTIDKFDLASRSTSQLVFLRTSDARSRLSSHAMTRLFWALAGIKAYRPTGLIFLALLLLLALFCALVVKLLLWLNDLWDSVWVVLVALLCAYFCPAWRPFLRSAVSLRVVYDLTNWLSLWQLCGLLVLLLLCWMLPVSVERGQGRARRMRRLQRLP